MKDDYTRVLVSFYEKNIEKPFTSCERDLFLYLLCVWAKANQVTPFSCSTSQTERDLSIPRKTIMQCRRRLCERGLISFHEGKGKGNNPYYFFSEVTDKVTVGVTVEVTDNVTDKVTVAKEEIPPTPPKEENNNNKETSSSEEVKKVSKKTKSSIQDLPSVEVIDEKKNERMDWKALEETFNKMMPSGVPKIEGIKEDRRKKVKARIKEYGKEKIMIVLKKIAESDYLSGRNRKPGDNWKCNFDFIFSPSGFTKILEGNYDNHGAKNQKDNDDSGDVIIRSIKL